MKLRLFSILFANILCSSVALGQDSNFSPRPGFGDSLYVDPSGNDTVAQKGSLAHKFKTIQAAINVSSSGDVVEVGPGTYAGNVTLKSGITLQGDHPRQCVISGNLSYAPTGGAATDVAHVQRLQVTGTLSCDFSGKTGGGATYGFLDIRECQFPTLTCLARVGLGNDGVSVQDYVWDTLPETFDFTCTNGFFDLEHVEVGNIDSEGDAFGSAVVANVSGTTTINSNGGFNFSQGIITGNINVAASKGTALHLFQTSVKGAVVTIGAASTVVGTASRLTGGSATAGAGTYDPDTNLVAGSGITVTQVAGSDQFRITNTSSPGTEGLPAVLAVDPTMTVGITPGTDNAFFIGTTAKRLSSVNSGQYLFSDGASNLATLTLDSAGKINLYNPTNTAGSSSTMHVWNNVTGQAEVLDLGWASNVGRVVTTQGGTGVARDLQVGTVGAAGLYFITSNSNRWLVDSGGNLQAVIDDTFNIGGSPTVLRPKNVFVAEVVNVENSTVVLDGPDSKIQLKGAGHGEFDIMTTDNTPLVLGSNNTSKWDIATNGDLLAITGDTFNIGGNGFNRPNNLYLGGTASAHGGFTSDAVLAYLLGNGSVIRNTGASTSTTYMDLGVAVFRDSFAGSLANHAVVAVAGNSVVNQNGLVAWAGGTDPTGALTTAFSQDSADGLDLGNGSFGDKSGTLNLAAVNATGTVTVGALALPRGKPVVTADKVVTPTTVTNTTTETAIYTFSVPGNTLGTAGSLRLTLCGNLSSALVSPGAYTVRVYYGATSFALVNGATLGSGDANAAVRIVVDLSAGNATNAQLVNATYDDNSGAVGSVSNFQVRGSASEDSTAAKTFKVTVQFGSASLSNTFVTEFAHTELLQ